MSNVLAANVTLAITWVEDLGLLNSPFTHVELNQLIQNMGASSTPPIVNGAVFAVTMGGGGTATIDLTNLTGSPGGNRVDGSNGGGTSVANRVQIFGLWNKGANAVTISNAGSNSYGLWGTTYSKTLQAGQYDVFVNLAAGTAQPQVLSTQKNILLTGTSGDTYWILVLLG
jgi:hypothetical protein